MGKRALCNAASAAAHHGIIVFIDADTQCQRHTFPRLVAPFADLDIGGSIRSCEGR